MTKTYKISATGELEIMAADNQFARAEINTIQIALNRISGLDSGNALILACILAAQSADRDVSLWASMTMIENVQHLNPVEMARFINKFPKRVSVDITD